MRFTTRLDNFHSDLWGHHINIPDDVVRHFLDQDQKRVICTLNGKHEFHCALMPKGNGLYFININKEIRKKLGLWEGSEVEVHLRKDDSKYGLPIPEELGELLKLDEEGSRYFHELTPGKQRSLIHIAGSPKTSATRLKKAVVIVDYLKAVQGKLDYKELNRAFKEANDLG